MGALPRSLSNVVDVSVLFVKQVWQIITGKVAFAQSVGGPIRIAQMATQTAEMGILTYLGFMALLSMSLAILNFLPFPALDGGHMVFLVYEGDLPARGAGESPHGPPESRLCAPACLHGVRAVQRYTSVLTRNTEKRRTAVSRCRVETRRVCGARPNFLY